jgi:dUTP pyrophosphatase
MTAPVIRVLQEDWADTAVPLPRYETTGAAGADIRANLLPEDRAQGVTL